MKRTLKITASFLFLLIGIKLGHTNFCAIVCDQETWQQKITLINVEVDNGEGYFEHFDSIEIKRSDIAVLLYQENGSRRILVHEPGSSDPRYKVIVIGGLKSFAEMKILPEHLDCCYLYVQNGSTNNQPTAYIHFSSIIEKPKQNERYELEITVQGFREKFKIPTYRAKKERLRIERFKNCPCENVS